MTASNLPTQYRYTWGDSVRVVDGAPVRYRPGSDAEVVGLRTVETDRQAESAGDPVGTRQYVIEFADGSSVELAESWLEPAPK